MEAKTSDQLWGGETTKAVENFQISGHPIPAPVIHWLGRIKAAAARANAELGELDSDLAERIAKAGDEVAAGEHDDQFPIDVFQTGSGTSSNMNANEVIAGARGRRGPPERPRQHGAVLERRLPLGGPPGGARTRSTPTCCPRWTSCAAALERKADEFADLVKTGRTHLMDAVPVTLGQEFAGYAAQIRLGADRVRSTLGRVGQIPLGGTATGTGLNTHPEFAAKVREQLSADTGLDISEPADPFEAQANRDALVELSGALKTVAVSLLKIANDLALMGSGPRAGLAELALAGAPEGVVDHARQGQPGDPRGRDPGRRTR